MTDVDTVAVLGAGDMGHGIAELAALHGYQVRLRDVDDAIVDEGLDQIAWSLDKLADEARIDEGQLQLGPHGRTPFVQGLPSG